MSPQMMRFFTLVGIALVAASLQLKARAGTLEQPDASWRIGSCIVADNDWRTT